MNWTQRERLDLGPPSVVRFGYAAPHAKRADQHDDTQEGVPVVRVHVVNRTGDLGCVPCDLAPHRFDSG